MASQKITEKSQLVKANEKLNEIKDQVTADDRKEAFGEYGLDSATISLYLNNKGRSLDTAMKLLTFFRSRIVEREKQLA